MGLDLPLKRLSLRVEDAVKLDALKKAKWFDGLERLELWLPPSVSQGLNCSTCQVGTPKLGSLKRSG